jgi:hypothetical protein
MFTKREKREKKLLEIQRSTLALVRMKWQRFRVDKSRAKTGPTYTQYSAMLLKRCTKIGGNIMFLPTCFEYTTTFLNSEVLTE